MSNLAMVACKRCNMVCEEDPSHPHHPKTHYCQPKTKEREFQLIEKDSTNAQKAINQWRHEYDIEIISVQSTTPGYVVIALWRTKK